MTLTKAKLERFTAFADLEVQFSPGINAIIGENGTGKTHLMKVCYAACDVAKTRGSFAEKLVGVFMPANGAPGRLIKRQTGQARGAVAVHRSERCLRATFSTRARRPAAVEVKGYGAWADQSLETVYIPVKDMLSNAPGFRSLYATREVRFEEVYRDILDKAYLPILRGPADKSRRQLLNALQKSMEGKVVVKDEDFFLYNKQGNLEFSLLAEGIRKLGLLWVLIQNGVLQRGSVLFWDEPETNLNPKMFHTVMNILLELQRDGVQVFFATHNYAMLKELDLQMKSSDKVAFHSLYSVEANQIACYTTDRYLDIHPNAIDEAFDDLYDREIERSTRSIAK